MAKLIRAIRPFRFYTRLHLQELTGIKVRNLKELLKVLQKVPGGAIYHHTHRFLQQHQYLSPGPPNDFAWWVANVLGEKKLAESLATIDAAQFHSIRLLREKIIETIKAHLEGHRNSRSALCGQEFYFVKSVSFIIPTPYRVWTLQEFESILKDITIHSLYYHIFEARLRLEKEKNDFSVWIGEGLRDEELARSIDRLDPYTYTMEGLRQSLLTIIKKRIGENESG